LAKQAEASIKEQFEQIGVYSTESVELNDHVIEQFKLI
jgi:hypothetical protein